MLEKNKNIFAFLGLMVVVFLLLALRPVPTATLDNSIPVTGYLSQIQEGEGEGDVVLRLKGDATEYYINRGIEKGLQIAQLKQDLLNQKITLLYARHWTPLDPTGTTKHLNRVRHNDEILYDEIE